MKNKTKNHRVFTKCPQFCGHFFCSLDFYSANRDENFCYRFTHGQKLMPQFRKIIVLVCAPLAQAENPCRIDKYPKFSDISFVRLIFSLLTAPRIFAISLRMDKSSCRNFAKLSSWWVRRWRKRIFFISFVAFSDNKKALFRVLFNPNLYCLRQTTGN